VGLVLDAAALINEVLASSPESRIAGQLEGPRSPKIAAGSGGVA
jgi:hypothetical protein